MGRELVKTDAQDELGAPPRPATGALDFLQPLEETTDIDDDGGAVGRQQLVYAPNCATRIGSP